MTEPAWKQFLSLKNQAPAEQKPETAVVTPDELKLQQATDGKTLLKRKRSILKQSAQASVSTETGQDEPPAKRLGKRQRDFIASQQESAKRASQAARQRTAAQHAAAVRVKQDGAQQAARQATLAYLSAFVQEKCGGPAPVAEAAAAAAGAGDEAEPGEKEAERADDTMSAKKRLKLEKRARKAAERAAQAQDSSTLPTLAVASTAAPGSAGWKFSKQRQNHLLRQLYSVDECALFDAGEDGQGERLFTACAVPYVAAIQGASRTRVLQEAEALVARYEKQQGQPVESEKTEAAKESNAETEDAKAKKEADAAEVAEEDEAVSETVYKRALQIVKALSEEATA